MKNIIRHIMLILLGTTVLSSCSAGMFDSADVETGEKGPKSVVITGLVTDAEVSKVLEDITIRFNAYRQTYPDQCVITDEVHTGNDGTFTIRAMYSDSDNLLCILTAEDPEGIYHSLSKQIIVTWKGISYDKERNMYVVNDCNFQLRKTE